MCAASSTGNVRSPVIAHLATALGQKVPLLSDYLKLLPAATQKDDIDKLKSALTRLPKRVVVLDEIDRMEKEEIITLLKVIRGISTLPNLSFVCALDRRTIVKTVKGEFSENNEYFEKFFPVLIPVPEPDPWTFAERKRGCREPATPYELTI
jgi:KAP family P-loop domain